MKRRGPIRYRLQDDADLGKKPSAAYVANLLSVDQMLADPNEGAAQEGDGQWYILRVRPGSEHVAASYLAGRRFGIYVPERKTGMPLFPGYVFVFSRDIVKDHRRIVATEDAISIMRCPDSQSYAQVQIDGTDGKRLYGFDAIDRIKVIENYERSEQNEKDLAKIAYKPSTIRRRRPRRSKKLNRRKSPPVDKQEHVGLYSEAAASFVVAALGQSPSPAVEIHRF